MLSFNSTNYKAQVKTISHACAEASVFSALSLLYDPLSFKIRYMLCQNASMIDNELVSVF